MTMQRPLSKGGQIDLQRQFSLMPVILALLIPVPQSGAHPSVDEVDRLREGHLVVKCEETHAGLTCHIMGNLDEGTSGEFCRATDHLPFGKQIVFDLSAVPYMDLAGLAALVQAMRRVGASSEAAIGRLQPPVRRLLQSASIDWTETTRDGVVRYYSS